MCGVWGWRVRVEDGCVRGEVRWVREAECVCGVRVCVWGGGRPESGRGSLARRRAPNPSRAPSQPPTEHPTNPQHHHPFCDPRTQCTQAGGGGRTPHLGAGVDHLLHHLRQLDHRELAGVADVEGPDVSVVVHHCHHACGGAVKCGGSAVVVGRGGVGEGAVGAVVGGLCPDRYAACSG